MIVTIKIKTSFVRRIPLLLKYVHRWMRRNPAAVLIAWDTVEEEDDR